jgi:hypothetical protein
MKTQRRLQGAIAGLAMGAALVMPTPSHAQPQPVTGIMRSDMVGYVYFLPNQGKYGLLQGKISGNGCTYTITDMAHHGVDGGDLEVNTSGTCRSTQSAEIELDEDQSLNNDSLSTGSDYGETGKYRVFTFGNTNPTVVNSGYFSIIRTNSEDHYSFIIRLDGISTRVPIN